MIFLSKDRLRLKTERSLGRLGVMKYKIMLLACIFIGFELRGHADCACDPEKSVRHGHAGLNHSDLFTTGASDAWTAGSGKEALSYDQIRASNLSVDGDSLDWNSVPGHKHGKRKKPVYTGAVAIGYQSKKARDTR